MTEERLNIKNEMDDQSSSDEDEKENEGIFIWFCITILTTS